MRAACIDGAEIERPGMGLSVCDDVFDCLVRRACFSGNHEPVGRGGGDGDEIGLNVVRQRLEERFGDRQPATHHDKGISVGWRFAGRLHADDATGPWPVFNKELLTEALTKILRHQPHGDVSNATGAVRDNDLHRLRRVGVALCRRESHRNHEGE